MKRLKTRHRKVNPQVDDANLTRPRIVFLDHSTEPGGAEIALTRLLKTNPPWDAVVIIPKSNKAAGPFEDLRVNRVRVLRHGSRQQPGASQTGIDLMKVLRHFGALASTSLSLARNPWVLHSDILYANTTRSALYASVVGMVARKIVILHLRDLPDRASLGRLGLLLYRQLAASRCHGAIANSQTTADAFLSLIKPDKKMPIAVIPSPIGLVEKMPGRRTITSFDEGNESLQIGMVARIDEWKGQHLLIEAFAKSLSGTNTILNIIGGPAFGKEGYFHRLQDTARRLEISKQVFFSGHVEDPWGAIGNLDICVQYSTRPEPLGQNVLQYLASGKAVVASAEGGPSEYIINNVNGLLCRPNDVEALAHCLKLLVEDMQLRNRLSVAAKKTEGILSDNQVRDAITIFLKSFN